MGFLFNAFHLFFYQPLFSALIWLYNYLPGHDFGIAVITLTVLIKILLYPLNSKGIKSQKALQEIQPKIKELQEKFKNDKGKQARATLELYKKEKINPFSGILPLILQLPILIALFQIFGKDFSIEQGQIDTTFFGIIDLAKPSIILAVLTGFAQFIQTKMVTSSSQHQKTGLSQQGRPDFSGIMQKQMLYFFPIFTIFILWRLPSALALYWITTTLFTIGQQYITFRKSDYDKNQSGKN